MCNCYVFGGGRNEFEYKTPVAWVALIVRQMKFEDC